MLIYISGYSIIIPIVYWLFNRKYVREINFWIVIYIFLALAFELEAGLRRILDVNQFRYGSISFTYIELYLFLGVIKSKLNKALVRNLYILVTVVNSFWVYNMFTYGTAYANYFFGYAITFSLIVSFIYFYKNSIKLNNEPNDVFVFAFMIFNVVRSVIYSFIDYFTNNIDKLVYFNAINAFANVLLSLIITYGMYICRKQLFKASL